MHTIQYAHTTLKYMHLSVAVETHTIRTCVALYDSNPSKTRRYYYYY